MTNRQVVVVVCVAVALLVSPTILAQESGTAARNTTTDNGTTAEMGAQLTAFTQSSSAAANDSVENGMWKASFERSNESEQARLVRNRTGSLADRLDRLQAQNESLQASYENGSVPEPAYIARQSRLNARIDALQTAINDTDDAATTAGVNDSRLDRLRQNASELRGPAVAGIARGLGGGPPANRGPPEDAGGERGPPDDRGGESGPPGDRGGESGPPDNRGGPTNESEAGGPSAGSDGSTGGNETTSSGGDSGGSSDGSSGGSSDGSSGGSSDRGNAGQRGGGPANDR